MESFISLKTPGTPPRTSSVFHGTPGTPPRTSSVFHGTPGTPPRASSVFHETPPRASSVFHGTPGTPEEPSMLPVLPSLVQGRDLMSRAERAFSRQRAYPGMIRRSLGLPPDTDTAAVSSSLVTPAPEYRDPLSSPEGNLSDEEPSAKKRRVES